MFFSIQKYLNFFLVALPPSKIILRISCDQLNIKKFIPNKLCNFFSLFFYVRAIGIQSIFSEFHSKCVLNRILFRYVYILKEIRYKMYTEFILLVSDDTRNPEWQRTECGIQQVGGIIFPLYKTLHTSFSVLHPWEVPGVPATLFKQLDQSTPSPWTFINPLLGNVNNLMI